jgi:hypothetical protein
MEPLVDWDMIKNYYVERQPFTNEFNNYLHSSENILLVDTEADNGMGKTTALAKLYRELRRNQAFLTVWLEARSYSLPNSNPTMSNYRSLAALGQCLVNYSDLLKALADSLDAPDFNAFGDVLEDISDEMMLKLFSMHVDAKGMNFNSGNVTIRDWNEIGQTARISTGSLSLTFNREGDAQLIEVSMERTAQQFSSAFVERFNKISKTKRAVLFVDDYCKIVDQRTGQWLLNEVIDRLQNLIVVLSRTTMADVSLPNFKFRRPLLEIFGKEQVVDYLTRRFLTTDIPDRLVISILDYSAGYPIGVALVGDYIHQQGIELNRLTDEDIDGLIVKIRNLRGLQDMIEEIYAGISQTDSRLKRAIEIVSTVRRFDQNLMAFIMQSLDAEARPDDVPAPDGLDDIAERYEDMAADLLKILRKFSFIHYNEKEELHSVHQQFYEIMQSHLRKDNRALHQKMHRVAAQYYHEWLFAYEDNKQGDRTTYERWYRYEDPVWQNKMSEWLFHLAMLEDRKTAHFNFAKIYFDAHWWWGLYVPFPFCEKLLEEWQRTQITKEDRALLDLILKFHHTYPVGRKTEQSYGKVWQDIRGLLNDLLNRFKINSEPFTSDDEEKRHLRGIIDLYKAESFRFSPNEAERPKAEDLYTKALNLFVLNEDEWNQAWSLYECSDYFLETKQFQKAVDYANASAKLIRNDDPLAQDHELMSKTSRVRADVYWHQQDYNNAFLYYALSIWYAYLFHAYPPPADDYTMTYHAEVLDRTSERLVMLWKQGEKDLARKACAELRNFFAFYHKAQEHSSPSPDELDSWLENGDQARLIENLLLPAPQNTELGENSDDYLSRIYAVFDMAAEIKTHGPLSIT